MLNLISSVVSEYSQIESSRWIVIAVCVVGVLLAWVTDEGYALLVPTHNSIGNNNNEKKVGSCIVRNKKSGFKLNKSNSILSTIAAGFIFSICGFISLIGGLSLFFWLPIYRVIYKFSPHSLTRICDKLELRIAKYRKLFKLYQSSYRLHNIANSRRHFFYLMEKEILGLKISEDETEIDSYLDCKNHLGSKWPFMWEINSVRDSKIKCAGESCIPMSSYSYLDLMRDSSVQDAALNAAKNYSTGNHGPRMLGGNTSILMQLEDRIARFYRREKTLTCATGYLACMSACAAVSMEDACVFADSRLHASLRAGLKLGSGKTFLFKHNDFDHLEALVSKHRSNYNSSWIIIESVYSMDGDIADLPQCRRIARKYDCEIMIDEAHGMGVVGATGRGLEEHFNLFNTATLIVGTFSKSCAGIGGYITGPARLIDYLDFHAPGNVFSAPLPAYCAGGVIRAIDIIDSNPSLVKKAQDNAARLRSLLESGNNQWPADYPERMKYRLEGDAATTVLPLVFKDDIDRVMRIASAMKKRGFMMSAVAYPACPLREPRFRVTATAAYDDKIIIEFVNNLIQVCLIEKPSAIIQSIA